MFSPAMTQSSCLLPCSARSIAATATFTTSITTRYHTQYATLPARLWDVLLPQSPFLQADWQRALAAATPTGVTLRYITLHQQDEIIGILPLQIIDFDAVQSIRSLQEPPRNLTQHLKRRLARILRFNVLLIGNLLATGEHAYAFAPHIEASAIPSLIQQALHEQRQALREERIAVTIIKEFFYEARQQAAFQELGYLPMTAQPNMILRRRAHWHTWEDYLTEMTSKYRVRTKRTLKKGKGIQHAPLSLAAIKQHRDRLHELYQATMSQADFNTLYLTPDYLAAVKAELGVRFQVTGYWIDEQLVGFTSYLIGENSLEAHFLGLDGAYNRSHQLYHNMLYDHVRSLLQHQKDHLILARTALEIKSSVGADPHDMYAYVKFRNPILQRIARRAAHWLVQSTDWTPRNPFPAS